VIAAAAILALLQIVAISATAVLLIGRRMVLARAELRREALLRTLREPVLELVALEDEPPPQALQGLRTTAEREAVGELLARYAGDVRGGSRERIASFLADQGYVAATARGLGSRREWRRGTAAKTLGDFASPTGAAALEHVLADEGSDQVRLVAARSLGRIGGRAASPAVLTSCAEGAIPPAVAAQALLDLGREGLPWVVGATAHSAPTVRAVACRVLGLLGGMEDADTLVALQELAVRDPEWEVRTAACEAIGRVGGEDSGLALAGAMGDARAEVRVAACDAATRLAAAEVEPLARKLLFDAVPMVARAAGRTAAVLELDGLDSEYLDEGQAEIAWGWT
jgi:HEAT repeat protein